jgi:hypothetical protein
MTRSNMLWLFAATAALCACGGSTAAEQSKPASPPDDAVEKVETWQAPAGSRQINIWPGAAPDGTFRTQPGETVRTYRDPGMTVIVGTATFIATCDQPPATPGSR